MKISIEAKTGAKQERIEPLPDNQGLKVFVKAQPIDGKANEAIIKLLAKHFGVRLRDIEIVAGHRSNRKRVAISHLD